MGGARFTSGPPLPGGPSRAGISPKGRSPLLPIGGGWAHPRSRISTRPRVLGFLNADALWRNTTGQVDRGWMASPPLAGVEGDVATYHHGAINDAFCYCVGQAGKLQAFDDLKHNAAKLRSAAFAPAEHPTWRHADLTSTNIWSTRMDRKLYKTGRDAACRLPSMRPVRAKLASCALHDTVTSR